RVRREGARIERTREGALQLVLQRDQRPGGLRGARRDGVRGGRRDEARVEELQAVRAAELEGAPRAVLLGARALRGVARDVDEAQRLRVGGARRLDRSQRRLLQREEARRRGGAPRLGLRDRSLVLVEERQLDREPERVLVVALVPARAGAEHE